MDLWDPTRHVLTSDVLARGHYLEEDDHIIVTPSLISLMPS
jgi:hypothetical protein